MITINAQRIEKIFKANVDRIAALEKRDRDKSDEIAKLRAALAMLQADYLELRRALRGNKAVRELDSPRILIGDEWTNAKEAAARLGISVQAVGQQAKSGKLKHKYIGRSLFVECSQLPPLKLYSA